MTEAKRRANDAKRAKHKAFALEHGLSEYKVSTYGIRFLEVHPEILETLKLVHNLTGYENVDPEVLAVRHEVSKRDASRRQLQKKLKGAVDVECVACGTIFTVGGNSDKHYNRRTCSPECEKTNRHNHIIKFRNKNKNT